MKMINVVCAITGTCTPSLQILLTPALALPGEPPLVVNPEKYFYDDKCDVYNHLKPVPLSSMPAVRAMVIRRIFRRILLPSWPRAETIKLFRRSLGSFFFRHLFSFDILEFPGPLILSWKLPIADQCKGCCVANDSAITHKYFS